MKKKPPLRKIATPLLETTNLRKGQKFTSKVWAKHTSRVTGPESYSSVITRIPLGRSHFNHVACSAAMQVTTEPNNRNTALFLPLSGSMQILVGDRLFQAAPGVPMLLPHRTAMEFSATPIECLLLEIPASGLLAELRAHGSPDPTLEPRDWSTGQDATALVRFLHFLTADLMEAVSAPSSQHLRRMEGLLLSCVAGAIHPASPSAESRARIGRMRLEELRGWIAERLDTALTPASIAAMAGISTRMFQKAFLKHFHTTLTRYLLGERLEAVRKKLKGARSARSVSEIAHRYQFHHLGRFAQAYRNHFGELPSETLARRLKKGGNRYPNQAAVKSR